MNFILVITIAKIFYQGDTGLNAVLDYVPERIDRSDKSMQLKVQIITSNIKVGQRLEVRITWLTMWKFYTDPVGC